MVSRAEIKDTGRAIADGSGDMAKKLGHTIKDVTKKSAMLSGGGQSRQKKEVVDQLKDKDGG